MLSLALNTVSTLTSGDAAGERYFLSDAERERFSKIKSPIRKNQFLAGRKLLRQMLCSAFGGTPSDWSIDAADGVKPHVVGHENIHFSLSHSADYVACAIADHPIGIDVERVDPRRNTKEFIAFTCSTEEQVWINRMPDETQTHQFIVLWTIKEAWLKQRGEAFDLASMRALDWVFCKDESADVASWYFAQAGIALSLVSKNLSQLQSVWPASFISSECEWRRFAHEPESSVV